MIRQRRATRGFGPPGTSADAEKRARTERETPKPGPPHEGTRVQSIRTAGTDAPKGEGGRPKRRRRRRKRQPLRELDRPLVFVGPMAAGKTSLGKRVAKELGVKFVDSDALFVRQHGPITAFFEEHGEAEFRRIEAQLIAEELQRPGGRVVALGGGAVITESTRTLLAGYPVVLLMTTQEAVLRTANIARRPLLRDDPNAWGRILRERKPLYDEVADVTYRTDRATKEYLARKVAHWARTTRAGR